jgi:hypothetical protein
LSGMRCSGESWRSSCPLTVDDEAEQGAELGMGGGGGGGRDGELAGEDAEERNGRGCRAPRTPAPKSVRVVE